MPTKPRIAYEDTKIPVHKTREEIDRLLRKHGATGMMWAEGEHPAHRGIRIVVLRFVQRLPQGKDSVTIGVRIMVPVPAVRNEREQDQLLRQYHRVLLNSVTARFVDIEAGLRTFTEAFFAELEVGGRTVYEQVGPQYLQAVLQGDIKPLALLPG